MDAERVACSSYREGLSLGATPPAVQPARGHFLMVEGILAECGTLCKMTTTTITLGERGRMVLPSQVRRELGLQAGERMVVVVDDDGTLTLRSFRAVAEANRGIANKLGPKRKGSAVDELIAERRREAKQEASEGH
jgi:AbrB family looped-hinge helix DNA binding protein